jgi:hypothetical protein
LGVLRSVTYCSLDGSTPGFVAREGVARRRSLRRGARRNGSGLGAVPPVAPGSRHGRRPPGAVAGTPRTPPVPVPAAEGPPLEPAAEGVAPRSGEQCVTVFVQLRIARSGIVMGDVIHLIIASIITRCALNRRCLSRSTESRVQADQR